MNFGSYFGSIPHDFNIQINNILLEQKFEVKYLGINFDSNLKWDKHIEYILNKTKYLPFLMHKLSKIMNIETLRLIYYAFFHSLINYGIVSWGGGAYSNYLGLLQNLRNRLLKIINKNKFIASENPLNLEQLFTFNSLMYHYESLQQKFITSTSVTRKKLIVLPKNKKAISNECNYVTAVRTFNELPNEYKVLQINVNNKNKIKEWIVQNPIIIPQ